MNQWICCLTLLIQLVSGTDRYLFSNFDIESDDPLIINSTSKTTFLCTKKNGNDEENFEVTTHPAIPFGQIRIYENRLNNTAIALTIHSINYVGMFTLVCSSPNEQSVGKELDVIVGAPPDAMTHVDNCTVYENRYINCTIHAPILSRAIHNNYPCYFDMMETHSSVYRQPAESVEADISKETITFRWLPVEEGVFPDDIDVLIIGEMRFFGKENVTINLTPRFLIQPNFTVQVYSPNKIQIQFHQSQLGDLFCQGNLTKDEQSKEGDIRLFKEHNPTKLDVAHLFSNTWYQICFQCYRTDNFTTISEVLCQRIRTHRSFHWLFYLLILVGILFVIIMGVLILMVKDWGACIKRKICHRKGSRSPSADQNAERTIIIVPNHPISFDMQPFHELSPNDENQDLEMVPLTSSNTEGIRDSQ